MRLLLVEGHVVAEGAGAAPIAAARRLTERLAGKRVACWVSGGNATADSLRRALDAALSAPVARAPRDTIASMTVTARARHDALGLSLDDVKGMYRRMLADADGQRAHPPAEPHGPNAVRRGDRRPRGGADRRGVEHPARQGLDRPVLPRHGRGLRARHVPARGVPHGPREGDGHALRGPAVPEPVLEPEGPHRDALGMRRHRVPARRRPCARDPQPARRRTSSSRSAATPRRARATSTRPSTSRRSTSCRSSSSSRTTCSRSRRASSSRWPSRTSRTRPPATGSAASSPTGWTCSTPLIRRGRPSSTRARAPARRLVELKCYRYQPHTSDDDDSRYRTKDEVREWMAKDPLDRARKYLGEQGVNERGARGDPRGARHRDRGRDRAGGERAGPAARGRDEARVRRGGSAPRRHPLLAAVRGLAVAARALHRRRARRNRRRSPRRRRRRTSPARRSSRSCSISRARARRAGRAQRNAMQLWLDQQQARGGQQRCARRSSTSPEASRELLIELRRAAEEDGADAVVIGAPFAYDETFARALGIARLPVVLTLPAPEPTSLPGGRLGLRARADVRRPRARGGRRRDGARRAAADPPRERRVPAGDRRAPRARQGAGAARPRFADRRDGHGPGRRRARPRRRLVREQPALHRPGRHLRRRDALGRRGRPHAARLSLLSNGGQRRGGAAGGRGPRDLAGLAEPRGHLDGADDRGARRASSRRYAARYGAPSTLAATAYDALALIDAAAESAGGTPDRARLRERLEATTFAGITTRYTFTAARHAGFDTADLVYLRWSGGARGGSRRSEPARGSA